MPTFRCQNPQPCPRIFTVHDDAIGRKANCPVCGFRNTVFSAAEQAEIDRFCAEHGSDIKSQDADGKTLLHKAFDMDMKTYKYWGVVVVKYLVARGADINATDNSSHTPLYLAALHKNAEVVKFLVSKKELIVNTHHDNGFSPLHRAIFEENVEIIRTLISHKNIDVNVVDKNGKTPLHAAVRGKNIEVVREVVKTLLSHKDENGNKDTKVNTTSKSTFSRGIYTDTPLHAAVSTDDVELVDLLLANGAKEMIDVKCGAIEVSAGRTPREIAEHGGSEAMVACLSRKEWRSLVVTLKSELDEFEKKVNECERKINNGEISVAVVKQRVQKIASSDEIMTWINTGNVEKINNHKKATLRASEIDTIDPVIKRLSTLKDLNPDDTRIPGLGRRAAKCYMKLHEIGLSASEEMCTPDFRQQMQSGNREILKSLEEMLTKMFPVEKNFVPKPPAATGQIHNQGQASDKEQEDPDIELPYTLILLWVGFGGSCVLAITGIFLWILVTLIVLPIAIVTLILALKERDRLIENDLRIRSEQGDVQAQYDLAHRLQRKKLSEAMQFLEKAAENGLAQAQYEFGLKYKEGEGIVVEKNPVQAAYWFEKAADQGLADAQYEMGFCLEKGMGVRENLDLALSRYWQAANQQHVMAQSGRERVLKKQREEEERRAEQQRKEQYKRDILSGAISYDSELRQIAATILEYTYNTMVLLIVFHQICA